MNDSRRSMNPKRLAGLISAALLLATAVAAIGAQKIAPPSETEQKIIAEVRDLKAAGKNDEALALLRKGREEFPKSLHLRQETFLLLMSTKRYDECIAFIDETYPDTPDEFKKDVLISKRGIMFNLFQQAFENKDFDKAYATLKRLADSGHRNPYRFLYRDEYRPLQAREGFDELIGKIEENAGIGRPALDFTTRLLDGEKFTLSEQQGRVVLVNFWDTGCIPCRKEFPALRKLYQRYREKGFEIISINLDEGVEKLDKFLEKESLPWKHVCSGKGFGDDIARLYEVTSTPYQFLVDKKGVMRYFDVRGDELEKIVSRQIGE